MIAGAGADAEGFALVQLSQEMAREAFRSFQFGASVHRRHSTAVTLAAGHIDAVSQFKISAAGVQRRKGSAPRG